MTDPSALPVAPAVPTQSIPTPAPVATPPAAAPKTPKTGSSQQSPLDVLDQILNEAQSKAAKGEEEKQKEEERKRLEEAARQREEDQKRIEQQLAELQTVKQSPQYQALVEQQQEVIGEKEEKAKELEGMEIVQIGHTTL
jgi:hypothetical protein